ncbi:DEAD/DEAH box helicase [Rhodocytophaga aerolata]|uniref:DEAD/DEAH box helicase n=1 Tax=Rhodocytophaga aerolata TaxID=455078 RepID=A0ABT8R5X1_9BACT|nr:DEAD/DEAH box helicase [Rhodocytophaga aerolata]MDO1447500.1 DEAD/DEAH box helicase [Rhodocytophaga aerolata]
MSGFSKLPLSENLLQNLRLLAYTQPTAIQQEAIPFILAGKDVAAQAETGSGKTATYGLPILQHIDGNVQQVQALVIVPTRELATQVREELKRLGKHIQSLKISAVYGGHSFSEEEKSFRHPPQILIATPGRLLDHLRRNTVTLQTVEKLVIDEADKLLEMNFEEELNQLLAFLPKKRQSLLFSATLPDKVKMLISQTLVTPVFIQAGEQANPEQISFIAYKVPHLQKVTALLQLLAMLGQPRAVIFCNTRERVEEVAQQLNKKGLTAEALHGAMEQLNRDKALLKFKNGSAGLLVATDLAARGIHIAALGTVIHLEILREQASFLHRSGRTGRAGAEGNVYVLLSPEEEGYMQKWSQDVHLQWKKLDTSAPAQARNLSEVHTPEFLTLHIKAGKKEKISPRDIVGAIMAEAGLSASEIGKIEVHDHYSYVAVPYTQGKDILDKLNTGKIKGRKIRVTVVK